MCPEIFTSRHDYSFTFTIPTFKNVKYKSANTAYGKLTFEQQYEFLEDHLQNISKFDDIKWVYELHKDIPRLHIHGFIKNEYYERVEQFRNDFYSNYKINMSYKSYIKMSDIQETIVDINYFENYCKKHQHEIKYFMRVIEDKKHSEALDKGIKIECNNGPKHNSLDMIQESENRPYEKYLFGKLNNFTLQF